MGGGPNQCLLIPAAVIAAPAAALSSGNDDQEIRKGGRCNEASSSKIKVKEDDGRLEVEFEVDQNRNGVKWNVKIKDNGEVAFKGNAMTKAPSGSFSLERKINDQPGADSIVAVGRNPASGERCIVEATL